MPGGTFRASIEIGDPRGSRFEMVEALVDAGASYTWVPGDLLHRLDVLPQKRWEFKIDGGRVIERDVGETRARYENETRTTIVVFGDEGSPPLLGAYTLEGFRLSADPVNRRLIRVRSLAMAGATPWRQPRRRQRGGPLT